MLNSLNLRYGRLVGKNITIILLLCMPLMASAQSIYLNRLNNDIYFLYEKQVYQSQEAHTSVKPYLVANIVQKDSIDTLLCVGVKKISNIAGKLSFSKKTVRLSLLPVLTSTAGYSSDKNAFQNSLQAGFSTDFTISDKFSANVNFVYTNKTCPDFYTNRKEAWYSIDSTQIVPHFGKILNIDENSLSYILTSGYMSYSPSKYVTFQAGVDKNFFGDGYRSLFLSDNAGVYPFFRATVNAWHFKYVIMYSMLEGVNSDENYESFPPEFERKFTTTHYLSYNVVKRLNINLFETVIFSPEDSVGHRGFDVNYLNPVIFFRPVEFSMGSPDNVIMGAGFKLRVLKNTFIYGQGILDEFIFSEVFSDENWWGNKYGYQIGFKSFDVLSVPNLYLQSEINYVRPFTYSHENSIHSYSHNLQSLAHPYGANLKEYSLVARYRLKNLLLKSRTSFISYGEDLSGDSLSYGQNIHKPYTLRNDDYGIEFLQGTKTQVFTSEFSVSYILIPRFNLSIDAGFIFRKQKSDVYNDTFTYFYAGLKTRLYNE